MFSVSQRARAVAAATMLAPLLAIALPATTASASTGMIAPGVLRLPSQPGGCPDGYLCLYRDVGYAGGGYAVNNGRALNDFRGIDFNDVMSSWVNETSSRYCWYPDINYTGTRFAMRSGGASDAVNVENNDIASSTEPC
ncbi:peptidase inhibitor family I36 protein [Streptomyces sp. NPDC088729]|uniref:peptidase inhibitor family I36 protein n=1 Tax=Streptomyces sp. NPDC088729 TaxID=3365876 RepID=UPI00381C4AFD